MMRTLMTVAAGLGFLLRACSADTPCDQASITKMRSETEALKPVMAVQKTKALRQLKRAEKAIAAGNTRVCRRHLKRAAKLIGR
jgi:hypothetical protein